VSADTPLPNAGHPLDPRLPLTGFRVVDTSSVFAVPYLSAMLADLGAEVIRIEPLDRLCQTRQSDNFTTMPENEPGERPWDRSGSFSSLNRNKRAMTLDLSTEDGRQIFLDLVAVSDIVLENYTPRVMKKWRLTYADLCEVRPNLVMLSNTGYGHDSPWADHPVQGTALEPMTGVSHFTGYRGDRPWKAGQSYPDFIATWHGMFALMAALRHRVVSGEGQWIDLAMYQASVSMIGEGILDYASNGRSGGRSGNRDATGVLVQGCYRARGDEAWVTVSAGDDAQWKALAALIEGHGWTSEPPASLAAAQERHDEVDRVLGAWTAGHDRDTAVAQLREAGLAAGPVNDARDLILDEHLGARGFYAWIDHDPATGVGRRPIITRPWRSTVMAPSAGHRPPPVLGEANAYVLKELLGRSEAEYRRLVETGVTGVLPAVPVRPAALSMDDLVRTGRLRTYDPGYRARLAELDPGPASLDT
jgi:crotonobetainyl-CoA:carnitine CoA-transferase CaiB-like acyl-CoA transferase